MRLLILILCIFELLLITYWNDIVGPYVNPILLLVTSLAIAFVYYKSARPAAEARDLKHRRVVRGGQTLVFLLLSGLMAYKVYRINLLFPVDASDATRSDVIPTLILFAQRFVGGDFPYTTMVFPSHQLFPTYLPFTWLPYSVAELWKFDYRWIPFAAYWIAALYFLIKSSSGRYVFSTIVERIAVPLFPILVWCMIVSEDDNTIKDTVEALIAAYYLFLAISIRNRNMVLMSIALSLCLLSRYSVLVWVPLAFLVLLFKEKKQLAIVVSILTTFLVAFYWLPFLRIDPELFEKGYKYYTSAAIGEWSVAVNNNGYWHMGNGLGFTKWAISLMPNSSVETMVEKYKLLHLIMIGGTAGILSLYFLLKFKQIELRKYLLFSLKVYMTVFYTFVQVPYKYLFIVPIVISSAILLDINRKSKVANETVPGFDN